MVLKSGHFNRNSQYLLTFGLFSTDVGVFDAGAQAVRCEFLLIFTVYDCFTTVLRLTWVYFDEQRAAEQTATRPAAGLDLSIWEK